MQDKKETKTTTEVMTEVNEAAEAPKPAEKEAVKQPRKRAKKEAVQEEAPAPKGKPGRKPGQTKKPAQIRMVVQYQNNDTEIASIEERVKAQFVAEGHRAGAIKKLDIYIKPEEYAAYYVINEKFSGRVDLF